MEFIHTQLQSVLENFIPINSSLLLKVNQLVDQQNITISFHKGNWSSNFIVSGLIQDSNSTYSCKISRNIEENKVDSFKSQCHCKKWSLEKHCEHIASLLFYFHQQQLLKGLIRNQQLKPDAQQFFFEVTEYGTLIRKPENVHEQWKYKQFEELEFLLINKNTIFFPSAQPLPLNAKLTVVLEPFQETIYVQRSQSKKNNFIPKIELVINQENIPISIFSKDYIFDWKYGRSFSLSESLIEFFDFYYQNVLYLPLDDHMAHWSMYNESCSLGLKIFDEYYDTTQFITPKNTIELHEIATRPNFEVYWKSVSPSGEEISLPGVLKIFSHEGGFLSYFSSGLDALQLISSLLQNENYPDLISLFDQPQDDHTKQQDINLFTIFKQRWQENQSAQLLSLLSTCKQKEKILFWINCFLSHQPLYSIDAKSSKLIRWDRQELNYMLVLMLQIFHNTVFKYAKFGSNVPCFSFEVSKRVLFKNLNFWFKALSSISCPILLKNVPVRTWKPQATITRETTGIDWFNLEVSISAQDLQILQKLKSNESLQMIDNQLLLLDEDQKVFVSLLQKYTEKLSAHKKNELVDLAEDSNVKLQVPMQKARILELFYLMNLGFEHLLNEKEILICRSLLKMESLPDYIIPPLYKDILRPYQEQGHRWLRFLYEHQLGGCLADDMGLGKTIQTISLLEAIQHEVQQVLIVCPVSILWNWQQEIQKFSTLDAELYYGESRSNSFNKKIIITSYGLLRRDFDAVFSNKKFDILILDEVQQLKNSSSIGSSVAKQIKARVRFALTGTPVENDLLEFFNILDLCVPGLWGEQKISKNKKIESSAAVKRIARPFILRRSKSQVLQDLPAKVEQHVYLDFSDEERRHYNSILFSIKQNMQDILQEKALGQVLKNLLILRQNCLWQKIEQQLKSTKMDYLLNNIEQLLEEENSVLIFSQFTTYLDFIEQKIKSLNLSFSRIDGTQNMKTRQDHVQKFQSGKTNIFLISLRAGGFGLNLTRANYIFLMDPWWNPAVENQAIDRAHRIGQERSLNVYRPIIKDSIEEKVLVLQQSKKKLFDDLLSSDDDEFYSGKLNLDDFKFLLS